MSADEPGSRLGPDEHRRERAGFELSDRRATATAVESESGCCLSCDDRDEDSCSKGLRDDKTHAIKKNASGGGQPICISFPVLAVVRSRADMAEAPLWAPWRMEYVLGPKPKGACIFCVDDAASDDELGARLVVCATDRAIVMMNRYPFAAGHLMVIPRRHASFLEELEGDECQALFELVRESAARLRRAVRCEGLNIGINLGAAAGAGIAEHLHVHVVPRWSGDTNFMPVIADTRVVPQALDATRAHLARHFADLPGSRTAPGSPAAAEIGGRGGRSGSDEGTG